MSKLIYSLVIMLIVLCTSEGLNTRDNDGRSAEITASSLFEQGRTLVHSSVKRFMVILPAIFFKLGIAFTLLVVVALAVVNNSVIGFLLLVVGLANILARVQDVGRRPFPVPSLAAYGGQPLVWQRRDEKNGLGENEGFQDGFNKDFGRFVRNH